jgi:site-specific DNA-cytosine methylase
VNVLSLFDGHRCGAMALQVAGVPITSYFASEVDAHAMQAARAVYPQGVDLGDVTKVNTAVLPPIDLLIGGSPCQGFSLVGKQLAFDDPRSALFFEYVRILGELRARNPDVKFLLENVRMGKEHLDAITAEMGVQPVFINSSLVSAQSRPRFYWTNIEGVTVPDDRGVAVPDIVETGVDEKYTVKTAKRLRYVCERLRKRFTAVDPLVAIALLTRDYANWSGNYLTTPDGRLRQLTPRECGRLQTIPEHHIHTMLTCGVSDTQLYKMFGNGWTVEVIAHIFRGLL